MNQYVNTDEMAVAISGIQTQISNIKELISGFNPVSESLAGTTFPIKDSVENSLKNVVNSYSEQIVPAIEKMNQKLEEVKQKYINSLNVSGN